jgi:hypothetical protein
MLYHSTQGNFQNYEPVVVKPKIFFLAPAPRSRKYELRLRMVLKDTLKYTGNRIKFVTIYLNLQPPGSITDYSFKTIYMSNETPLTKLDKTNSVPCSAETRQDTTCRLSVTAISRVVDYGYGGRRIDSRHMEMKRFLVHFPVFFLTIFMLSGSHLEILCVYNFIEFTFCLVKFFYQAACKRAVWHQQQS